MKKTINIFLKFAFTSMSQDAQPISLGLVAEEPILFGEIKYKYIPAGATGENSVAFHEWYDDDTVGTVVTLHEADYTKKEAFEYFMYFLKKKTKTFYAEFSDYDINRCDDWVKENVVKKLKYNHTKNIAEKGCFLTNASMKHDTSVIKSYLSHWLKQFKDYDIQFIGDCATWDWYHLLQLIGKWETNFYCYEGYYKSASEDLKCIGCDWLVDIGCHSSDGWKIGLPKLPDNISPVVQDLNDLIAYKKGISIREAFDLDREEMAYGHRSEGLCNRTKDLDSATTNALGRNPIEGDKHNALWDAKVIKSIFNKFQDDR